MSDIKFSIVTPVYNGEKTIARTIKSVLNQNLPVYEYYIIDGCSNDDTVKIAESFKADFNDKNIKYKIISEKDNGIYDAMNKGIKLSDGKLVGIINSDDWYEYNATKVMSDLYKRTNFDMAYADIRMHNGNSQFIKRAKNPRLVSSRYWNHPTQFVRRSIYDEKMYDNKTVFSDLDFLLWLHKENKKIECINETLANFTMGGASNNEKRLSQVISRIKTKYNIYKQNNYLSWYLIDVAAIELAKAILGK